MKLCDHSARRRCKESSGTLHESKDGVIELGAIGNLLPALRPPCKEVPMVSRREHFFAIGVERDSPDRFGVARERAHSFACSHLINLGGLIPARSGNLASLPVPIESGKPIRMRGDGQNLSPCFCLKQSQFPVNPPERKRPSIRTETNCQKSVISPKRRSEHSPGFGIKDPDLSRLTRVPGRSCQHISIRGES